MWLLSFASATTRWHAGGRSWWGEWREERAPRRQVMADLSSEKEILFLSHLRVVEYNRCLFFLQSGMQGAYRWLQLLLKALQKLRTLEGWRSRVQLLLPFVHSVCVWVVLACCKLWLVVVDDRSWHWDWRPLCQRKPAEICCPRIH